MDSQLLNPTNPRWLEALSHLRHDFYHLPAYVALEAAQQGAMPEAILLQQGDRTFFLPYLLRSCSDLFGDEVVADCFDAVSPYGYPGILLSHAAREDSSFIQEALTCLMQTFASRGICSVFLRLHPILNQGLVDQVASESCRLHSETIAVDLTLSEAEIWHQTRPEHRNKINKGKRAGLGAAVVPIQSHLQDFARIYRETMDRVGASSFYYFTDEYFTHLAHALKDTLVLCVVKQGDAIACAGLFTECCGIVQYHLGGTTAQYLKRSPNVLMFDYIRYWAKARGNTVLHLGGGVGGKQDSLHHFKAGFSKQRYHFPVMRLVTDPDLYHTLVQMRAKVTHQSVHQLLQTQFFPAYRG
ncbi:MAG: GNAT family N-acetyltransferase [Synechococcales bacterium]|nr:GNAT family N-acetyltransferase [Synechococcales bacterium]